MSHDLLKSFLGEPPGTAENLIASVTGFSITPTLKRVFLGGELKAARASGRHAGKRRFRCELPAFPGQSQLADSVKCVGSAEQRHIASAQTALIQLDDGVPGDEQVSEWLPFEA